MPCSRHGGNGKVQERTLVKEGRRFPALVQEGMPSPHVKEILGHISCLSADLVP